MLTIIGPTACGKTKFAVRLAKELDGEIISADSRQVYRHMDLGTGKDLIDYNYNGQQIPYHLIDIAEPGTKYNVYQYQRDFIIYIITLLVNNSLSQLYLIGTRISDF